MRYYLAPYTGAGTVTNHFRPTGSDRPGWTAIDLRVDSSRAGGFALIAHPDPIDGADFLTDDLFVESDALRRSLGARLGLNLESLTFPGMLFEILLPLGLQPTKRGLFEITIGGELLSVPIISGGASITETFNTADSPTLGPVTTWTEFGPVNWDVVSNQAKCVSGSDEGVPVMTTNFDVDHTVTATVVTKTAASGAAVVARVSDVNNWYAYGWDSISNWDELFKRVGGAYTALAGRVPPDPIVNGDTLKLDVAGSSLTAYRNGVQRFTATDSALTGTKAGLRGYRDVNYTGTPEFDNVTVNDAVNIGGNMVFHHHRI